uniref:Uncharacterized protein n=1 Tax=Rhizophora mucronata TaxID=61149 RepID=A0A2P2L7I4_RHIMU
MHCRVFSFFSLWFRAHLAPKLKPLYVQVICFFAFCSSNAPYLISCFNSNSISKH